MPPYPLSTKLLHIHLNPRISYSTSLLLQDQLLNLHWRYRAALKARTPTKHPDTAAPPPPPFLLSFSTHPTYTVGRRHLLANPLSPDQIAFLTSNSAKNFISSSPPHGQPANTAATFCPTTRGGLLTYHGPGQLTAYPVLDLRRFAISARCYVRLLENAVSRTCNVILDVENGGSGRRAGRSVSDPGVWMLEDEPQQAGINYPQQQGNACPSDIEAPATVVTDRKICALGVQVTRGVTAHGIGLNVLDEPIEAASKGLFTFDDTLFRSNATNNSASSSYTTQNQPSTTSTNSDNSGNSNSNTNTSEKGYLSWGFSRIVACGLEGKSTTWLTREGAPSNVQVGDAASHLAQYIARGINEMGNGKEGIESTVQTIHIVDGDEITALSEGGKQVEELLLLQQQ